MSVNPFTPPRTLYRRVNLPRLSEKQSFCHNYQIGKLGKASLILSLIFHSYFMADLCFKMQDLSERVFDNPHPRPGNLRGLGHFSL